MSNPNKKGGWASPRKKDKQALQKYSPPPPPPPHSPRDVYTRKHVPHTQKQSFSKGAHLNNCIDKEEQRHTLSRGKLLKPLDHKLRMCTLFLAALNKGHGDGL